MAALGYNRWFRGLCCRDLRLVGTPNPGPPHSLHFGIPSFLSSLPNPRCWSPPILFSTTPFWGNPLSLCTHFGVITLPSCRISELLLFSGSSNTSLPSQNQSWGSHNFLHPVLGSHKFRGPHSFGVPLSFRTILEVPPSLHPPYSCFWVPAPTPFSGCSPFWGSVSNILGSPMLWCRAVRCRHRCCMLCVAHLRWRS